MLVVAVLMFVKLTAPSVAGEQTLLFKAVQAKKHFGSSTSAEQLNGVSHCGAGRPCGDGEMSFDLTCALLKPPHPTECVLELHAGAVPSRVGRQGGSVTEGSKLFIDKNSFLDRSPL